MDKGGAAKQSPIAVQPSAANGQQMLKISSAFWNVCNTLADLKSSTSGSSSHETPIIRETTGKDLQNDFPQVVVVGDQNCGKSSLLNAMTCDQLGIPIVFPVADGQCTTRPFMFTLQYEPLQHDPGPSHTSESRPRCTIEVHYWEAGRPQEDCVLFAIGESDSSEERASFYEISPNRNGTSLNHLLSDLNSFPKVLALLCDQSESDRVGKKVFKLTENWKKTVVRVKLIICGSDPTPGSLCEFVDLPGLVRHPANMFRKAGINEEDIQYSDLHFDTLDYDEGSRTFIDRYVKPAWFNFLVHNFLQKPSTLILHVIKCEAEEEQVMSIRVISRVKNNKLLPNSLKAHLVKVFTKVDQSIRAESPTKGLLCNFGNARHEVFCDALASFFVGGLCEPQDLAGSHSSRCPSTLSLLMRGPDPEVDAADASKLQEYCQKIASEGYLGDALVRHNMVVDKVGPFAVKQHVMNYLGSKMKLFMAKLAINCKKASDELREDVLSLEARYPLIQEKSFIVSIDEWLDKIRIFASLVFGSQQSTIPKECIEMHKRMPAPFHTTVISFQSTSMKHFHKNRFKAHEPGDYQAWKTSNACTQFQILTGQYPKWHYQDNQLNWKPTELSNTGVSRESQIEYNGLPFDLLFSGKNVLELESGGFNELVLVERSVHALVKLFLGDAIIDRRTFDFVENHDGLDTRISGNWFHSFFRACYDMFNDTVQEYEKLSETYFNKEEAQIGKCASFESLQKLFTHEFRAHLNAWLYEKADEMNQKRNIIMEGQGAMQISEFCYLGIICQPYAPQNRQQVPIIFEEVVTVIAQLLKNRWHESHQGSTQPVLSASVSAVLQDSVADAQNLEVKSGHFVSSKIGIDQLMPYGEFLFKSADFHHFETLLTDATALLSQSSGFAPKDCPEYQKEFEGVRRQIAQFQGMLPPNEVTVVETRGGISAHSPSEQRVAVTVHSIKVKESNFHFINASLRSTGYTEDSLFWCLQVTLSNSPCQLVFRTLAQFRALWETMEKFGIHLPEDHLPSRGLFQKRRYHHLDFMNEKSTNLQTSLKKILEKIGQANPVANAELIKWLKFTDFEQSEFSDAEICEARQARHCDRFANVASEFQEFASLANQMDNAGDTSRAVGCKIEKICTLLERSITSSNTTPNKLFDHFSTLQQQIQGCQHVLQTAQFQEAHGWEQVTVESVKRNHNVLTQLLDQCSGEEFQSRIMKMHERVRSSTRTHGDSENSAVRQRVHQSDFVLEAQCVVVLEMAQRYIQKFMWETYSSVIDRLPDVLGVSATSAESDVLGFHKTFQKVKSNVRETLTPVDERKSNTKSLEEMFSQEKWEPYRGFLVPKGIRLSLGDIKGVEESLKKFQKSL